MQLNLPVVFCSSLLAAVLWLGFGSSAVAAEAARDICPRPPVGGIVDEPEDLRSENGVLKVDLTVRNETQADGSTRYCYVLGDGNQSPTLRLNTTKSGCSAALLSTASVRFASSLM